MKTIGHVLRDYRQKNHLSVASLSKKTSVPADFISALEEEDLDQLPTKALVRGYVRLLADEVGLPEESAMALFRRDIGSPDVGVKKKLRRKWSWKNVLTPRFFSFAVLTLLLVIGGSWILLQWQQLGKPPTLDVSSPQNYDIVASPIQVSGRADPNASLTINTQVVSLDQQGRFSYQLELPPGERTVVVQATDRQGKISESILFLTVE